ncbi:MAG: quinolinate synthase NadA [bacterium]|nr:quinolinate synthase NadA [bacterium]
MDIISKINTLKKEKNAIILAHCYQPVEIDEVADYVGDSFYLSKKAAETKADIIVFAGVHFMAQSAKLLNKDKKVLLPNPKSGCAMADMLNLNDLRAFKNAHPNIPTVCYINSTAEVKAECDICCTSSNALDVVKSLNAKEVLFMPDRYLGQWIEKQLDNVKIITYSGYCPTHYKIEAKDIENARVLYPNAKILAHPECRRDVTNIVDFVGSTKEIMEYCKTSKDKLFVIATEKGVTDRLNRDSLNNRWGKTFIPIKDNIICEHMKFTSLEDIYNSLITENYQIEINENIFDDAKKCISSMMNAVTAGAR